MRKTFPQTHSIPLLRGAEYLKPCQVRRALQRRMAWLTKRLDEQNSPSSRRFLLDELIATAMALEAYELQQPQEGS